MARGMILATGVTAAAVMAAPEVATAEPTPAQQRHMLAQYAEDPFTYFKAAVLDDAAHPNAVIEVSEQGKRPLIEPILIRYGGRLAYYAGRAGEGEKSHIEMLAADEATVQEYLSRRIRTIHHPAQFAVERVLHASPDHGPNPPAFTDGREAYAYQPRVVLVPPVSTER